MNRPRHWSRYPTPGEIHVLRTLARGGALRGVQIVKASRGKIIGGHVYVLLARLLRKKVIERARMIDHLEHGGPKVPVWRITAWGRRTIRAMDMLEAR